MNLGARLEAIIDLAKESSDTLLPYSHEKNQPVKIIADIGTDHAKLPIEIIRRGLAKKAIAADKNAGPLSMAENEITKAALTKKIEIRQGDGLNIIKKGEIFDIIFIAGLGGELMIHILQEGLARFHFPAVSRFILQPQTDIPKVRKFLIANSFILTREKLVKENRHYYVALVAAYTDKPFDNFPDEDYIIGKYFISHRHQIPYWQDYTAWQIEKLSRAINGIKSSNKATNHPDYIRLKHEREIWQNYAI